MPEQNPLDRMAEELASWADTISTQMAESIKGGFNAPGAAQISEREKLEFYTRQLFNPDGSPNVEGRVAIVDRLGAQGFAEVYDDVTRVHPELAPAPLPSRYALEPTDVPGVSEVVEPHDVQDLRPTGVAGVAEVTG